MVKNLSIMRLPNKCVVSSSLKHLNPFELYGMPHNCIESGVVRGVGLGRAGGAVWGGGGGRDSRHYCTWLNTPTNYVRTYGRV